MTGNSVVILPRFIEGAKGQLFTISYTPEFKPKADVLFFPSLGEELNRCRKMVTDQARLLASMGFRCWVLDYYGTGDSDGDFSDIDWDLWLQDAESFIENNLQDDLPLIFFGLRTGALFAVDLASRISVDSIVLFQPVTSGEKYVTQLLRQRSAFLMANNMPSETVKEIRARVESGELLEVGGYLYSRGILDVLGEKKIEALGVSKNTKLIWLENVKNSDADLAVGSRKITEKLQSQGYEVKVGTFFDPPIWQLHGREDMLDNLTVLQTIAREGL